MLLGTALTFGSAMASSLVTNFHVFRPANRPGLTRTVLVFHSCPGRPGQALKCPGHLINLSCTYKYHKHIKCK